MGKINTSTPIDETPSERDAAPSSRSNPQVHTLSSLLAQVKPAKGLTPGAKAYVKLIEEILEDATIDITAIQLDSREWAGVVFTNNGKGIALCFSEGRSSAPDVPPITAVFEEWKTIRESLGDIELMDIGVIGPEDYARAPICAEWIRTAFVMAQPGLAAARTADIFASVNSLQITSDPNEVRRVLSENLPQASIPRTDIGVVISILKDGQEGKPQHLREYEPLAVVGGYTMVTSIRSDYSQYTTEQKATTLPLVNIPSVYSMLPCPEILALILPIAAAEMISRNAWLEPFRTFSKGEPDLANVVADPKTGKPCKTTNSKELHDLLYNFFLSPQLVIDVVPGLLTIPGLHIVADDENKLLQMLRNFYGATGETMLPAGTSTRIADLPPEWIGLIDGQDSRLVDYLTVIANGWSDISSAEVLMHLMTSPKLRAEWITANYTADYQSRYLLQRVPLSASFVETLGRLAEIARIPLSRIDPGQVSDNLAPQLAANNGDFTNMSQFGMSNTRAHSVSGFNPWQC